MRRGTMNRDRGNTSTYSRSRQSIKLNHLGESMKLALGKNSRFDTNDFNTIGSARKNSNNNFYASNRFSMVSGEDVEIYREEREYPDDDFNPFHKQFEESLENIPEI